MLGLKRGAPGFATLNALMLEKHTLFIADTYVQRRPERRDSWPRSRCMAAEEVRRFGLPPKVAFLSHSNFGSSERGLGAQDARWRATCSRSMAPDIECDGEMHGDAALSDTVRHNALPETTLNGAANLLICPNLDAANILFNVLKMTGGNGVTVGPILLGAAALGPHPHAIGHRAPRAST